MFRFVTKSDLWTALQSPWAIRVKQKAPYSMKSTQDIIAFGFLHEYANSDLAEIGGGHSRVLPTLATQNRCTNIEPFEGVGKGPTQAQDDGSISVVNAYVGRSEDQLPDASFDVVFSISVVEHVATDALSAFHVDCVRLLRPNGLLLHLIDMYLGDEPQPRNRPRLRVYRQWLSDETMVPVDPSETIDSDEPTFRSSMASNPDNVMHEWSRIAPAMDETRLSCQGTSLILAARKRPD